MALGIQATMDAHLDWVVFQVDIANAFKTISCKAISQKFRTMGNQLSELFPFVCSFYGLKFFFYIIHHSFLGALYIIISSMGTHQGDLLTRLLFALIYLCVLHCSSKFSFLSLFFLNQ